MEYKELKISCIPDCGENEGGYFCEVHTQDCDDRIDCFCIHPFVQSCYRPSCRS